MNIKLNLIRYLLMIKRLLKKPSFLLILLAIPLLTFTFTHFATTEETGFLSIALAKEEESDLANKVIDRIKDSSSMIRFTESSSPAEARKLVESGKCDGAWIFGKDLAEKAISISEGKPATLATAVERSPGTMNDIAKEQIFAAFYEEIAYAMYERYAHDAADDVTAEELAAFHEENGVKGELISFTYEKAGKVDLSTVNYLISPLRGLLSVIMLMCALAAGVYFISDERSGTYTLLSKDRRYIVLYFSHLAALTLASVFVLLALYFTGNFTSLWKELLNVILFALSLAGFSSCLCALIPSVNALCVALPVLCAASLVLSPVFFDIISLRPLQQILPLYHYMTVSANASLTWTLALYAAAATALGYGLYRLRLSIRKK